MEPTLDRRYDQSERVPLRIGVELGQGDFQDPFAADLLNLSKGGVSMRAPCLPDVGSLLQCRFECIPGGTPITAQGQVVWVQLDDDNSGEFGLAFVDLDPQTEWLLDELIAEHTAHRGGYAPDAEPSAPVSNLELEGSSEPIAARLTSEAAGKAVFEQQLDLLSLGRAVRALTPGAEGRAGNIVGVELRLVGNIPMLAVTVDFQPPTDYGEAELLAGDLVPRDTETDLRAPTEQDHVQHGARAAMVTMTEFDANLARAEASAADSSADVWGDLAPDLQPDLAPEHEIKPEPEPEPGPIAFLASPMPRTTPVEATDRADRDFSRPFVLEADPDAAYRAELDALSTPAWKPAVKAIQRWLAVQLQACARGVSAAGNRALPQLRLAWLRSSALLQTAHVGYIAPQFGALRRMFITQAAMRRRRTTMAPAERKLAPVSGRNRTLLIGLLAVSVVGLGVFAFFPSAAEDVVELKHIVVAPTAALPATQVPAQSAAPNLAPTYNTQEPSVGSTPRPALRAPVSTAPDPLEVPSAERVPEGSPFAVDLRGSAAVRTTPARALRFGAAEVRHGRRFALRMSAPVQALQGVSDAGGFSVVISGSLSLDRAGPIGSSVKAVQRAMIINKGDRAELSIRFVGGKSPAYQVSAEGSTVYVVIEDV
jgi:hypothetical protein